MTQMLDARLPAISMLIMVLFEMSLFIFVFESLLLAGWRQIKMSDCAALRVLKLQCPSRPFQVRHVVCNIIATLILQTAAGAIVIYSNSYCFLPHTSYLSMINRLPVTGSSFIIQRVISNILWDQTDIWVPCVICLVYHLYPNMIERKCYLQNM